MNLDKLFGSRAKTDILKFLVFRRQGVSVRAFETELSRSFPAIKKQVDQLDEGGIIQVTKDNNRRSIYLVPGVGEYIRELFIFSLRSELNDYFSSLKKHIDKYFLGDLFGKDFEMDLVIVHPAGSKDKTKEIKDKVTHIFTNYHTSTVKLVFMSTSEFDKRNRLADKFVLNMMTNAEMVEM